MASPYDPNAGGQVPPGGYPGQAPPPPAGYPGPAYPNTPGAQQGYTPQRPGMLTAAAVLAFVSAGFQIIAGIIAMAAGGVADSLEDDLDTGTNYGALAMVLGLLALVYGAVYIWGGVVALSGKNTIVLTVIAGISALTEIIGMIILGPPSGILGIALGAVIIGLTMAGPSREFVRSKGGKTF
jgi:hypothetical protein